MIDSLALQDATVVGAMTSPRSKAPFNRAHLVARADDGRILRAQTFTSDNRIEGPLLSEAEWRELVETEHALELPSVPLVAGAALWVLRPGLRRRDQAIGVLRAQRVLLREHVGGAEGAWLCLVDESSERGRLRDQWQAEAVEQAMKHARAGEWGRAAEEAEVAHAVGRGLDPEVLALLSLVYERTGRAARANGLVPMARRSRGEEFAAQVIERVGSLRAALVATPGPGPLDPPAFQPVRPRNAGDWRRLADQGNQRALLALRGAA